MRTALALLGIAMSSLPRSARSAAPVANLPLLVLEFISGVFVPFTSLSHGLYNFAGLFPLKWIAEGYRSALLPSYFQVVEPSHVWDRGEMALVMGSLGSDRACRVVQGPSGGRVAASDEGTPPLVPPPQGTGAGLCARTPGWR